MSGIVKISDTDGLDTNMLERFLSSESRFLDDQEKINFVDLKDEHKILKDKKKREFVEKTLSNKNILSIDDEDLYKLIKENFSEKDIAKSIYLYISKRLKYVYNKAQDFRNNMYNIYAQIENPSDLMKKVYKYIEHLNLSEVEKDIFVNIFRNRQSINITGNPEVDEYDKVNSLSNFFGIEKPHLNVPHSEETLFNNLIQLIENKSYIYNYNLTTLFDMVNDDLYKNDDSILKFYNKFYGSYEVKKNVKPSEIVHPVIFALFSYPNRLLDYRFNIQNIGRLLLYCKKGKRLLSIDRELMDNLVSDYTSYFNTSGRLLTVVEDLNFKVQIQIALWKIVFLLRNKNFMNCDCSMFYNLLSMYSTNIFNTSKESIESDSIGILERLFSIINYNPLKLKYMYEADESSSNLEDVSKEKDPEFQIFKKGPGDMLYSVKLSQTKLANLKKASEDYYTDVNKSSKIKVKRFIYLTPPNEASQEYYYTIHNDVLIRKVTDTSTSDPSKKEIEEKVNKKLINDNHRGFTKVFKLHNIDKILIFIIIRNRNIQSGKKKYRLNLFDDTDTGRKENSILSFSLDDTQTESYNNNKVKIDSKIIFTHNLPPGSDDETGIEENYLIYSVILNSVVSDGGSIKGNPFSLNVRCNEDNGAFEECVVYRPYDTDYNDRHVLYYFSDKDKKKEIIDTMYKNAEIYIYLSKQSKKYPITNLNDKSSLNDK